MKGNKAINTTAETHLNVMDVCHTTPFISQNSQLSVWFNILVALDF